MGQYVYAKSPIGIFAFSENGELLHFKLFSHNAEKAVDEFLRADSKTLQLNHELHENDRAYAILRERFREYAVSLGFVENNNDLNRFLADFGFAFSKKRLAGAISRDRLLMQSVNALEDMKRVTNLFHERLYEWFSLHYPELRNTKDLADKIITHGRRENFPEFRSSTGVDLRKEDEEIIVEYASLLKSMQNKQDVLEKYVSQAARDAAPNVSSLIDPVLAAKLISQAGSLEKLARMPASTIQLLGAEKALFRHLKKKGRSPKYGIIFTSSIIQSAHPDSKGKAARILSSKLTMAAKIDFFSGRFEPKLKNELDQELKRI